MTKMPEKLTRKAIKSCFPKLREATWDCIFDKEKRNGLAECRVEGPDALACYDLEAVKKWLVYRGHYTPDEFDRKPVISGPWSGLHVKTHALAG